MEHFYKKIIIMLESCILLFFNSLAGKRTTLKFYLPQGQRKVTFKTIWRGYWSRDFYHFIETRLPSYRKSCSCSSCCYCILNWLLFYSFRYLDNNELKEISSDAFDDLKNLESLYVLLDVS